MFYDKQIKYLDVYEKEEKVQNAGFVRLEAREDKVNLQLRAEKLRHTDTCTVQVMLASEEKEAVLGEISLAKGKGFLECRGLRLQDMGGGIPYGELCEIYLKLPGERMLRCIVREREPAGRVEPESAGPDRRVEIVMNPSTQVGQSVSEAVLETAMITGDEVMSESLLFQAPMPEPGSISEQMPPLAPQPEYIPEPTRERIPRPEQTPEMEPMPGMESMPSTGQIPMPESMPGMGQTPRQEPMPGIEPMPRTGQTPRSMSEPGPVLRPTPTSPVQERPNATTKWQQLSNIYPHIRPFEDGRDYLKIKPEDFVILTKKYYPLATNSFLKHGYYNYEHLILAREMRQDGEHFYIGVPGNFYDKEKQVAVLFGFESFEGQREPAKNGDFGYYMIPVEI